MPRETSRLRSGAPPGRQSTPGRTASERQQPAGTRLQTAAGNEAVLKLVDEGRPGPGAVQLLRSEEVPLQRLVAEAAARPARELGDVLAGVLPPPVAAAAGGLSVLADALRSSMAATAVQVLVAAGFRDEDALTNLVFWARHPQMAGQRIAPEQHDLASAWLRARDGVVRPALRAVEPPEPGAAAPPPGGGGRGPAGRITSERLGQLGSAAETEFRRRVYDGQLARNLSRGRQFFPGLPVADLEVVEEDHRLHVDAAGDCRDLLAQARADLALAQAQGDRQALRVRSIGVRSAYRDPERDFAAWQNAYATHYRRTADERAALPGGPHGAEAVGLLVRRMATVKAVPGFSNHTRGLAVDLGTREGSVTYGPSSAQSARWLRTWLHAWLVRNAGSFGFRPYAAEPWHWDHD